MANTVFCLFSKISPIEIWPLGYPYTYSSNSISTAKAELSSCNKTLY